MNVRHLSHINGEWFKIVDEDPDCDFETGKYIGLSDMLKFSNGKWYPKNECQYVDNHGNVKSCCS